MNEVLVMASSEIALYLALQLPKLDENWWKSYVIDRLTFHQQSIANERGYKELKDLDLAALLRVLDQNWHDLSKMNSLPRETRNWIKELQTIRNRWAHLSSRKIPFSEIYRDADTLARLMKVIQASDDVTVKIEAIKKEALKEIVDIHDGPIKPLKSGREFITSSEAQKEEIKSSVENTGSPLFTVGNFVSLKSNPKVTMPVINVTEGSGENRYTVFWDNKPATYYESQLSLVQNGKDNRICLSSEEFHAAITSNKILAPSSTDLYSLRSGRVQYIPYQYRPVLKFIRADRPRMLIADEVGVGKTIEAGLILKELKARFDVSSILVICPKPLVSERKWHQEMKRFDESFTTLDGKQLRHCIRETDLDGEWPDQHAKTIVPFSLFDSDLVYGGKSGRQRTKTKGLIHLDPPPKFDLVIVDEAHHIRNSDTYLHQGIKYFCDNAEAVLFLTATPVQLGSEDLYTLLNVLRPDLILDQASFRQMSEPNLYTNKAVQHCRSGHKGWIQNTRESLDLAVATEWGQAFIKESPKFQKAYDLLLEDTINNEERIKLIRSLEELYTFSSLINRTRRRDIGEFTTRKPETLAIEFTPQQLDLHNELLDVISRILTFCHGNQNVNFMMTTVRRQAASCIFGLVPLLQDMLNGKVDQLEIMIAGDSDDEVDISFISDVRSDIIALLTKAECLDAKDPKVEAFLQKVKGKQSLENNKVLLFSTFRHTLSYLSHHIEQTDIRYGVTHGGISDEERSDIRRRFALPKEDVDAIDVLLSSEIGCEGLDYQFCDFLINYDLPWNPMRIEDWQVRSFWTKK